MFQTHVHNIFSLDKTNVHINYNQAGLVLRPAVNYKVKNNFGNKTSSWLHFSPFYHCMEYSPFNSVPIPVVLSRGSCFKFVFHLSPICFRKLRLTVICKWLKINLCLLIEFQCSWHCARYPSFLKQQFGVMPQKAINRGKEINWGQYLCLVAMLAIHQQGGSR